MSLGMLSGGVTKPSVNNDDPLNLNACRQLSTEIARNKQT